MNEPTNCPLTADGELVHRYVAGVLEPEELADFETHLLACESCQRAVREGAGVRAALLPAAAPGAAAARRPSGWLAAGRASRWVVPAAAAAVLLWLVARRPDALELVARVEAPRFAGAPVRAAPDSASLLTDSGMAAYQAGRYGDAARLLSAAGPTAGGPATAFYLGAARLMSGAPREAIADLRRAAAAPGSPYADEAGLLEAKAWLRLGRADSALATLNAVPADRGAAHALADSVRRLMR